MGSLEHPTQSSGFYLEGTGEPAPEVSEQERGWLRSRCGSSGVGLQGLLWKPFAPAPSLFTSQVLAEALSCARPRQAGEVPALLW